MATSSANQNSIADEYPVCMKTIRSVPVYQFANGHVICKVCIEKLKNCPICRNDSPTDRSLKLKNIVQKQKVVQPGNRGPTTENPNLPKRGKGSVRYGTINGLNQVVPIGINLQANPWQAMPTQTRPLETRPRQTVYNGEISDWQFLCRLFGTALFLVSICFALFYIAESYNSS